MDNPVLTGLMGPAVGQELEKAPTGIPGRLFVGLQLRPSRSSAA